jgi:hypothetical protein
VPMELTARLDRKARRDQQVLLVPQVQLARPALMEPSVRKAQRALQVLLVP